jgi:hypothetical protein
LIAQDDAQYFFIEKTPSAANPIVVRKEVVIALQFMDRKLLLAVPSKNP